jgi:hypothetical protein
MATIEIKIDAEMTNFMIRNILGHEPCHDFNPAGAGSRYVKLNKQLENLKIGGIYQEGGSGKGPSPGMKEAAGTAPASVLSLGVIGDDNLTINSYEDMKPDSPSTVFNNIAISEDDLLVPSEDDLLVPNVDGDGLITGRPDNESNIFYSTLGADYNSFLNEFDVDAKNMDNTLVLKAPPINRITTRSMTQSRSNTINGIQSTTEMTDYIRMYMFNYIAGAGRKLDGDEYVGGKVNKPDKSMIKEEIEEEKDNALMPIENKKKKTDIATTLTKGESELKQGIQKEESELKQRIQEGDSELKQGIQEGEAEAEAAVSKEESATQAIVSKEEAEAEAAAQAAASVEAEAPTLEAAAAPSAPAAEPTASVQAASTVEAAPAVEAEAEAPTAEAASTAEATISDRYQEYSYLNNALTHIIKEFDEYDKLDDDALIDVWSIDTDISRPYLKETNNIFVFYKYIFNYYINNINNILSIYLINDSYFIRDAIFFFFINHFNTNEEKFLEIKDEEKKKGILNEIFNLRIPEWSDDNKYLTSIKKNKKEEIVEKTIASGQKGGDDDDDDEVILSLQIINMTTGLGPVTPVFNDSPKTVTIGDTDITTQDILISTLKDVYESLISDLMEQIRAEGNDKYVIPYDFDNIIRALRDQLIGEYVTNSKSVINQLKPKGRGAMGSLFTSIKKYITPPIPGARVVPRGSDPRNLIISINKAINTITTNLKARIIRLVSVVRYSKIKIQGTKTTSLSQDAQVPVNMILQTVCEKVNDIIDTPLTYTSATDNNRAAQSYANDGDIFLTQKHIIDKIATGGSTSDVDTKLYIGFRNWLNDNQGVMTQEEYGTVALWNPTLLKAFIQNGTKPVKVINNALSDKAVSGQKMIQVLSDFTTGKKERGGTKIFQIKCPISSIFDAQGSFGSCNFGLDANKKKSDGTKSNRHDADVITDNMDIQITGTGGFLINLSLIFKPKGGNKGRALLAYTIRPGANYKNTPDEYKIIEGRIESVIRDEAIDILSAQTVFKGVFNDITAKLGLGDLKTHLTGADAIHTIMSGLTQKFMGDFGQELNAIATNFGKGGGQDLSYYTLLADGDRPSFVRASLLRSLATSGIDPQSYLWYMSPKGGVAVGPPPPRAGLGGGTIKKKTKKRNNKKKRKNRKTNKKKSKTRKNKTRKNKRKTKKSKKTIKKR